MKIIHINFIDVYENLVEGAPEKLSIRSYIQEVVKVLKLIQKESQLIFWFLNSL